MPLEHLEGRPLDGPVARQRHRLGKQGRGQYLAGQQGEPGADPNGLVGVVAQRQVVRADAGANALERGKRGDGAHPAHSAAYPKCATHLRSGFAASDWNRNP